MPRRAFQLLSVRFAAVLAVCAAVRPGRAAGQPAPDTPDGGDEVGGAARSGAGATASAGPGGHCINAAPPWWPRRVAIAEVPGPGERPCVQQVRMGPHGVAFVLLPTVGESVGVAPMPHADAPYAAILPPEYPRVLIIRSRPGPRPPTRIWLEIQLRTQKAYVEVVPAPAGEPTALAVLHPRTHRPDDGDGDGDEIAASGATRAVDMARADAPSPAAPTAAGDAGGGRYGDDSLRWYARGVVAVARMSDPELDRGPEIQVMSGVAGRASRALTGLLSLDAGFALVAARTGYHDTGLRDQPTAFERIRVLGRLTASLRVHGGTRWISSAFAGVGAQVRGFVSARVSLDRTEPDAFDGPSRALVLDATTLVGVGVERDVSRRVRLGVEASFSYGFPSEAGARPLLCEGGFHVGWY